MEQETVAQYIVDTFDGLDVVTADGNTFYFYDPGRKTPPDRRQPFATIVTNDLYDQASTLDRPGVYRLNLGVSRQTFHDLFGEQSPAADAAEADGGYDLTALDAILPHPVYGFMFWICVLNPSAETFEIVKPFLAESYERAVRRHRPAR